jgi:hypothetical protein
LAQVVGQQLICHNSRNFALGRLRLKRSAEQRPTRSARRRRYARPTSLDRTTAREPDQRPDGRSDRLGASRSPRLRSPTVRGPTPSSRQSIAVVQP